MAPIPDGNQDGPRGNQDEVDEIDTPQFNVSVESDNSSSDEDFDEDSPTNLGYQLLPQDPGAGGDESDSAEETNTQLQSHEGNNQPNSENESIDGAVMATLDNQGIQNASTPNQQLPRVPNAEAAERRALWINKQNCQVPSLKADDVQKIKTVMAGIKLPTPDWAKKIPEEEWKKQLFTRLQLQDSRSTSKDTTPNTSSHSTNTTSDSDNLKFEGTECSNLKTVKNTDSTSKNEVKDPDKCTENKAGHSS